MPKSVSVHLLDLGVLHRRVSVEDDATAARVEDSARSIGAIV
jgi:hypothetical protein